MDFFSSDYHFFHQNILRYAGRPFNTEREMRREIVKRHNEVVKPEDTLYVLGDVTLCPQINLSALEPVLGAMNGTKHLILGNHDTGKPFYYEELGFTSVHTSLQYSHDIILRHDPSAAIVAPDKLWLVGHVHQIFKFLVEPIKIYNVGVDVNNFYPVTLKQIFEEMDKGKGGYHPEAPAPTEWVNKRSAK